MNFNLKLIPILLLPLILCSQERTTIGTYWTGLAYEGYSDTLTSGDHLVLDSNLPVNQNFDVGINAHIGSLSVLEYDLLSYGASVDVKVHKKFDLGGITADPYFGVGIGLSALESYSWAYVGSDYYYNYYTTVANTSLLVPYSVFLGSEFAFNDFFSLVPAIGLHGLLNEDVDTLFSFGLQANFFFTDSISMGLSYTGDNESGTRVAIIGRYHL